jgi:hypothetical protein
LFFLSSSIAAIFSLIIDCRHNFFMKRLDQKHGMKFFLVLYAAVLQQPRYIAHYSSAA